MFDINIFTHLNIITDQSFTTGETVTGGTTGATGVVESISTTTSVAITNVTNTDNPGSVSVVTGNGHGLREAQQVTIENAGFQVDSTAITDTTVFTVRNVTTNTFELYNSNGTDINVTSYSSGGIVRHGLL